MRLRTELEHEQAGVVQLRQELKEGEEAYDRVCDSLTTTGEAREHAEKVHHPFCNFQQQPIGGPGCICVVTYKKHLDELERAEKALREIVDCPAEIDSEGRRVLRVSQADWKLALASLKSSDPL